MSRSTSRAAALWCKSNFSFLEGASHPGELVCAAYEQGLHAVALTDRDGVYGVVRAHLKAQELGVHLVVGAQVTMDDGARVVLLCQTRAGYANLCQLLTAGRLRCPKGTSRVRWDEVCAGATDLLALWAPTDDGALAGQLREAFPDRLYALLPRHRLDRHRRLTRPRL